LKALLLPWVRVTVFSLGPAMDGCAPGDAGGMKKGGWL
jgi:hypothetical protein